MQPNKSTLTGNLTNKIKRKLTPHSKASKSRFFVGKKINASQTMDAVFKLCSCHIQHHERQTVNCNYKQSPVSSPPPKQKHFSGVIFHQLPPSILLSRMMSIRLANVMRQCGITSASVLCNESHCMLPLHQ